MQSRTLLRFGLALTYLGMGTMIFLYPGHFLSLLLPWVHDLVSPEWLTWSIITTGIFDVALGIWLLTPLATWIAGLVSALHLLQVLATTGINIETVRDIGLLFASIVLTMLAHPPHNRDRLHGKHSLGLHEHVRDSGK